MKSFTLYTAARLVMFVVAWAVVWGIAQFWLAWDTTNAMWTALIALGISGVASLFLLSQLRAQFAHNVAARATRMTEHIDAARAKEDDD
ncbi:MAG: DUF4229 domain-containing protein [Nocardioidaceae bacterium]